MKKILAVIALLFILSNAAALDVGTHTVQINIDKQGYAHIIEDYFLKFDHDFEFEEFKKTAEENKTLMAWKADFDWFYPRFGGREGTNAARYYVTFNESGRLTSSMALEYRLTERFVSLESEEARENVWILSDKKFSEFETGGPIEIPETTTISITIPPEAKINEAELPSNVTVQGNTVILNGINTNYVNLEYSISKPIASVDSYEVIQQLLAGISDTMIIGILVVVAVLVLWKRERISGKIEEYIVEHSELERKEPEEETEIDI